MYPGFCSEVLKIQISYCIRPYSSLRSPGLASLAFAIGPTYLNPAWPDLSEPCLPLPPLNRTDSGSIGGAWDPCGFREYRDSQKEFSGGPASGAKRREVGHPDWDSLVHWDTGSLLGAS